MRILLDVMFRLEVGGGNLTHLRHLLSAWFADGVEQEHELVLVTRRENVEILGPEVSDRLHVHPDGDRLATPTRLVWDQAVPPREVRCLSPDVLFCPGNISPFTSPVPTVVMLRNALPFCPRPPTVKVGSSTWAWQITLGWFMRASSRTATRTIFNSRYLRDLFVRRFGTDPSRCDVVLHGADSFSDTAGRPEAPATGPTDSALLERLRIRNPFLLGVSHLYAYKHLPALVDGFAKSGLAELGYQLVLAGKETDQPHVEATRAAIARRGLRSSIELVGPVAHHDVASLLRTCDAFVFQSTCENCPNSLLEAIMAGVPIASSIAGPMPEMGGDAVEYYDPYRPNDIARSLRRVALDPEIRARLRTRAGARARTLSTWREAGRDTLESLASAASARGRRVRA